MLLTSIAAFFVFPGVARPHGPIAPVASSYFAKSLEVPAGLEAKVVDGDLRMWLSVPADETVVVLDCRGAPYLRFSPGGVAVNYNSSMYYLNHTPFAQTPPGSLTVSTPPSWHLVSTGHSYEWHDGRLHALATVALTPGVAFVGRWTVPLRIDGGSAAIGGGLWQADDPSLVWLWPIVVLLACVVAAWRTRRAELDRSLARLLANVALVSIPIPGLGLKLHGRPTLSTLQLVELAFILAFVVWGLWQSLLYFVCLLIGVGAIWAGGVLIPTLLDGFVLIALRAFLARAVTVLCLGCGIGLLLFVIRLSELADRRLARSRPAEVLDHEHGGVTESRA